MSNRKQAANEPALLIAFLAAVALLMTATPVVSQESRGDVKVEWLTWSFFRITSPGGKVILTNPWVTNPDSRTKLGDIEKADIILVPTGHRDEVGETVEVAKKTGAKVVTTWEMAGAAFKGKIPDAQFVRTQPGSSVNLDGIRIRVVGAIHGSGGANALYGGPALGFFITFENGYTLYFSGSTDLTMDMQLWGSLFKPDGALLYYSAAMHPGDVAHMVRLLSADNRRLKTVIPHHHRVNPPPGKSPEALAKAMESLGLAAELLNPEPRKVYTLSK
ncbi:MAG: MBL fold metallo-hydrolase [Nitrospiraceae bacterium]